MIFSDNIDSAASVLSSLLGCKFSDAVDHVENVMFNCDELSAKGYLDAVFSLASTDTSKPNTKGKKRDFWKKPGSVQMQLWLGMTNEEYDEFESSQHSDDINERMFYWETRSLFWAEAEKWQGRHYNRLNGYGIWWDACKLGCYGIFTKQQRCERYWKKYLQSELDEYGIRPLRIHG